MTTQYEIVSLHSDGEVSYPWSEKAAQQLALHDGLGMLSQEHWQIIATLRSHFVQYGALPPMQLACSYNHLQPGCVEQLFHDAGEARRIAGLPAVVDEVCG